MEGWKDGRQAAPRVLRSHSQVLYIYIYCTFSRFHRKVDIFTHRGDPATMWVFMEINALKSRYLTTLNDNVIVRSIGDCGCNSVIRRKMALTLQNFP